MMGGGAAPGGAMQWYYIDAQQNYVGPVDARGLEQLKVHGYVNNDTFVWAECLTGWQRLSVVNIYATAPAAPAGPSATPAAAAAPAAPMATAPGPPAAQAAPAGPAAQAAPVSRAAATGGRAVSACPGTATNPLGTKPGAVPPSLGIARKRQTTATPAAGCAGAAALAAPPPSRGLLGGNGRHTVSGCASAANPLSAGQKAGGAARAALGAAQPAAPAPNAGVQKDGVSIPAPIMAEHPGGEWDTSKGMRILIGAERRVRSIIADDGEVKDAVGTTLAYIESNGEIGDGHMTYAGKVHMPANHVVDHVEILVGEYDQGRGYIKDASGSVVAELNKEGVIQDNGGQSIGFIEGFTYHKVPILAAYFLIVDPSYVRSRGVSHVS